MVPLKIRKQFPIQLACAHTIHRSQGLTLDRVAFDPTGVQVHGLVYTALSRVKNIESLYLLNPLKHNNFKVKKKVNCEMQRLETTAKWQLEYDSSSIQSLRSFFILSLKTRNLHAHLADICNDYDTMQSDILCLQETHMLLCMEKECFKNFNCISSCIKHGVMILIKKNIIILEHTHFEDCFVEALLAKIKVHTLQIAILNIYASPRANLNNILNVIEKALYHLDLNNIIVILGDFNIDMVHCNKKKKQLETYMQNYNLHFLVDKTNSMHKSLIDHVWANLANIKYTIFVLDTYWFDHDTISLVLQL